LRKKQTRPSFEAGFESAHPMNQFIVWGILLIPGSWLVSLAILLRDEWRAHIVDLREECYLVSDKAESGSPAPE
jgi:hypothetical protein